MGDRTINPYVYVQQATANGESLLSLCSGIGFELEGLGTQDVTAIDIVPQYLEKINYSHPEVKTVCMDIFKYLKKQSNKSVDIISIIDGIEHLEKVQALGVIRQMKRVCRKQILLFTPQGQGEYGFLKNEPHDAWGISGADEHQTHKSGWTLSELQGLGFELLLATDSISQHDEPYTALMMSWRPSV